jgi:hypothetical protein
MHHLIVRTAVDQRRIRRPARWTSHGPTQNVSLNAESEIIFFLEGRDAGESVNAILNDPVSSTGISPWLPLFDGPLHSAPEMYYWERKGGR